MAIGAQNESIERAVHRGFEVVEVPELVGKSMYDALQYLKTKYGTRLANRADLEHISNNLKDYPEIVDGLRKGNIFFAFGWYDKFAFRVWVAHLFKHSSGRHSIGAQFRNGWNTPFPANGRVLLKERQKDLFEGVDSTIDPLELIKK